MASKKLIAHGVMYPQYQVCAGNTEIFVPEPTAVRQIGEGEVKLGTQVQESDGKIRPVTQGEVKRIKTLADEWATM
jgi:hypothetical protein